MTINPPKSTRLRRDPVKLTKVSTIKWKGLWMILSLNSETFHTKGSRFHQSIPTDYEHHNNGSQQTGNVDPEGTTNGGH